MPLIYALIPRCNRHAGVAALLAIICAGANGCAPPKGVEEGTEHAEATDTAGAPSTPAGPAPEVSLPTAGAAADADGIDNDCDGLADEPDERESRPLFRFDRDEDGAQYGDPFAACAPPAGAAPFSGFDQPLDCSDRDPRSYPGADELCIERGDEDCDGLRDCADPDCASIPCVEDCDDPADNDADGLDDCTDPDCSPGTCVEDCTAGGDRDRDGLTGCADPDCYGPACAEDCTNPGDEDADGLADCEDADCDDLCAEDCMTPGDEDADGRADCRDEDCALRLPCWSNIELTLDGGGLLHVRRYKTDDFDAHRTSFAASLQVNDVVVSGSSVHGAVRCAAALTSLTVSRDTHYYYRHTGTGWYTSSVATGVPAHTLHPDCPLPTPSELGALEVTVAVSSPGYREPGEPAFRMNPAYIITGPPSATRWAPTALHLGPVVGVVTRHSTAWGPTLTSSLVQTAVIDGFVRLE
ncbi:MAG: putative metal-binding motif-containing protein [Deltaproteobacteria bacterium]|jgi:hypothetical protein|nr:putative metal-binding motif-containing protein [Deltaproteobacteria bacterium]